MVTVEIAGRLPSSFGRPLTERLIRTAHSLGGGKGDALISLSLVDDRTMHRLNKRHRGKDRTTDVLSFPFSGDAFPGPAGTAPTLGEIVVSLPQVRKQARGLGRSIREEFALMLVHGTLHLLGYDHETLKDETRMFGLQHEVLLREGIL